MNAKTPNNTTTARLFSTSLAAAGIQVLFMRPRLSTYTTCVHVQRNCHVTFIRVKTAKNPNIKSVFARWMHEMSRAAIYWARHHVLELFKTLAAFSFKLSIRMWWHTHASTKLLLTAGEVKMQAMKGNRQDKRMMSDRYFTGTMKP